MKVEALQIYFIIAGEDKKETILFTALCLYDPEGTHFIFFSFYIFERDDCWFYEVFPRVSYHPFL